MLRSTGEIAERIEALGRPLDVDALNSSRTDWTTYTILTTKSSHPQTERRETSRGDCNLQDLNELDSSNGRKHSKSAYPTLITRQNSNRPAGSLRPAETFKDTSQRPSAVLESGSSNSESEFGDENVNSAHSGRLGPTTNNFNKLFDKGEMSITDVTLISSSQKPKFGSQNIQKLNRYSSAHSPKTVANFLNSSLSLDGVKTEMKSAPHFLNANCLTRSPRISTLLKDILREKEDNINSIKKSSDITICNLQETVMNLEKRLQTALAEAESLRRSQIDRFTNADIDSDLLKRKVNEKLTSVIEGYQSEIMAANSERDNEIKKTLNLIKENKLLGDELIRVRFESSKLETLVNEQKAEINGHKNKTMDVQSVQTDSKNVNMIETGQQTHLISVQKKKQDKTIRLTVRTEISENGKLEKLNKTNYDEELLSKRSFCDAKANSDLGSCSIGKNSSYHLSSLPPPSCKVKLRGNSEMNEDNNVVSHSEKLVRSQFGIACNDNLTNTRCQSGWVLASSVSEPLNQSCYREYSSVCSARRRPTMRQPVSNNHNSERAMAVGRRHHQCCVHSCNVADDHFDTQDSDRECLCSQTRASCSKNRKINISDNRIEKCSCQSNRRSPSVTTHSCFVTQSPYPPAASDSSDSEYFFSGMESRKVTKNGLPNFASPREAGRLLQLGKTIKPPRINLYRNRQRALSASGWSSGVETPKRASSVISGFRTGDKSQRQDLYSRRQGEELPVGRRKLDEEMAEEVEAVVDMYKELLEMKCKW